MVFLLLMWVQVLNRSLTAQTTALSLSLSSSSRYFSRTEILSFLLSKVRHSNVVGDGFQSKDEVLWIQSSQSSLPKEKKFPQWKVQFDLFMAEKKIWRCKG